MSSTLLNKSSAFEPLSGARQPARRVPIARLGNSLGLFIALTFTLCVLFDLWFPGLAMNSAWAVLLPGFVWISWPSFLLGLVETFAYGWYIALLFGVIYNFISRRAGSRTAG